MLLQCNLLGCFLATFKIVKKYGIFAFDWNSSSKRFVHKSAKIKYCIVYIALMVYLIVVMCQGISSFSSIKLAVKLQCVFIYICYNGFTYVQWVLFSRSSQLVNLMNHAIDLELKYFQDNPTSKTNTKRLRKMQWKIIIQEEYENDLRKNLRTQNIREVVETRMNSRLMGLNVKNYFLCNDDFSYFIIKGVLFVGKYSFVCSLPIFILGIWMVPCLPANFGYFLFPECHRSHVVTTDATGKIVCVTFIALCVAQLLSTFMIEALTLMVMAFCVQKYLKELRRSLNTVNRDFIDMQKVCKLTTLFRSIHLLTTNLNNFHQEYLSVVKLFTMTGMLTIAMFAVIRLSDVLLLQQLITFIISGFNAFLGIAFVYGVFGSVYSTSSAVNKSCKGLTKLHRNIWFRRHTKSWPLLKIKLGSVNYVDQLTPLISLSFCFDQLVTLLLLKG